MVDNGIRVLLIEDNPAEADLIAEMCLNADGAPFDIVRAGRMSEGLTQLTAGGFDLVLLDLTLPDNRGLDRFDELHHHAPGVPIVVLTCVDDESLAMNAVIAGAQDYLVKGQVDSRMLKRCMRYAIERKQAETKLSAMLVQIEKSHDDMQAILDQFRIPIAMTDEKGRITFLSRAWQDYLQATREKAVGQHWEQLFPFHQAEMAELKALCGQPSGARSRVPVHLSVPRGRQYFFEVEVHDDPRERERKIFYLYDMTEAYNLRRELTKCAGFHNLLGQSESMHLIYRQIEEVSKVDWTVLIEGETGVGKELVAEAIHFSSHRREKPFIPVNCAGLMESLLASQLFGHRRGAFTGAVEDHKGFFEAASGGTLFLDEIGDIPPAIQSHLLRAIETKVITRLGESKSHKVDVRLLAATNMDLNHMGREGQFRPDLLYRLRVARICIPPLRERRGDIPLLVSKFLSESCAVTAKNVREVSSEAMRLLFDYSWPGNVRELKSAIEFAVIHVQGAVIKAVNLPPEIRNTSGLEKVFNAPLAGERQRILDALKKVGGNRSRAAQLLGVGRATLYRYMDNLDIGLKRTTAPR
ncbi:MAG: sigma 54-interacting transcriptional regulator [Chlamydiota bacterium]